MSEGLNCINLHFLVLPFLYISAILSLFLDARTGISFLNLCLQLDANKYNKPLLETHIGELKHIKEEMGWRRSGVGLEMVLFGKICRRDWNCSDIWKSTRHLA